MSTENNELISVEDLGLPAVNPLESSLMEVAEAGGFLPRLQLFGGSSDAVKEGKIGVGRWGIVRGKDQLEDLGAEVDVLVVTGRTKALDVSGNDAVVSYDHKSDVFKDIAKRSEGEGSRCMFGPEYLVYIPSIKEYATYFMSSPTARREAGAIHKRLRKAATLKNKLIVGKQHKWHGPVIVPCSNPFDLPPADVLRDVAERFSNPSTEKKVEVAPAAGEQRER